MKLKYYLRGLGVGIIVTTILLMISFLKHGSMSDDQVIKRAEELGMVMQSTESINEPSSDQATTENTDNHIAEETEKDKDDAQTTNSQQSESQSTSESQVPSEPSETQTPSEPQKPEIVEITVEKGEYCRAISEKLANAGLVDDAEAFRKYMGQIKYDEMVTSGVYPIPRGASYEEIANILVSGNN